MNKALQGALRAIDELHAQDPQREQSDGKDVPAELLYAERMSVWLQKLEPNASEELQLAIRAQHLCRWRWERNKFPMDRVGYLKWRKWAAEEQSKLAERVLRDAGYEDATIDRVRALMQKKSLRNDAQTQVLEDCACLVFLEHHLPAFAKTVTREKLLDILRKRWVKMSERAQQAALQLPYPAEIQDVLKELLGSH